MFKCAYPSCGTKLSDKTVSFYLFPLEDGENLEKWLSALGRANYTPSKDDFICSNHFEKDCIEDGILKPNSVPIKVNGVNTNTSSIDTHDFDICRICGKVKEMFMTDIFDDDLDVCEKMSLCLPIVINPNDNLPQTICDECFDQLDIAANLIRKCLAAEEKLNTLFGTGSSYPYKTYKPIPINGPIICDKCQVFFSDMTLFDEHMVEHEDCTKPLTAIPEDPLTVCSTCGHIYENKQAYDSHKAQVSCTCQVCGEIHKNICLMNSHKCLKCKCDICGLMVKSESHLKKHIVKVHTEKMNRKSDQEDGDQESLEIRPNISGPKRSRNRKELYHCNICDIKFTSNKKLRDHCIEYHGTPNVLWICKFCGKSMTTKVSLQIHERIHFDSKPYICEWCGNGYRSRANLNQHQVIHTGIRNHECPKCGKRFSRKAFVRTHMRVHTGERPYVCDICGHRFTQLGDMKRHRNRHQNPNVPAYPSDRMYACDFCGENFTQLSLLKKHRLEHANQPITIIEEDCEESKDLAIDLEHDIEEEVVITEPRRKRSRSE